MLRVAKACESYNEKLGACVDSDIGSSALLDLLGGHNPQSSISSSFDSHPKCAEFSLEFLLLASNLEKKSPECGNPPELSNLSLDLLDSCQSNPSKESTNCIATESFSLADLCDESSLNDLCSDLGTNLQSSESNKPDVANTPVSQTTLTELLYEDYSAEQDCKDIFNVTGTDTVNDETTLENDVGAEVLDTSFSLLDLYVPSKERTASSSSDSLASIDNKSGNKVSTSPDCTDSGYSSEGDKLEQIDLSQAKSVIRGTDAPERDYIQDQPGIVKCPKPQPSKASKKPKPSLFFKTLCCQMKPENSSVAKVPTSWAGFLERKNYWQYFAFDTPSPDDVVAAMQNCVAQ